MLLNPDHPSIAADELLDALPYGVVLLGSAGEIIGANPAALALAPAIAAAQTGCCHDLFPCREARGPCERDCFALRAAQSGKPSPEIRIDTAGGIAPGALWVTAAPLPRGVGAILHLRPGWRGDRRRRSAVGMHDGPELRIRTLGRTHVEAVDDSLDVDWLSQRPGQILKYLVCERSRVVMVDEIAETFWPDSGPRAVGNTRYAIHRLRSKLEPRRHPHAAPAFVVARGGGYGLDRNRIWIDADEFERAVAQGQAAMTRLAQGAAAQHLERAMALYRGSFLADEPYSHWATDERNNLASLAIYALRVLTALARERNDGPDAIRHLQRLAELEPLDGGVHRELIQALIGEGRSGDAKRRFDHFTHRLRRDLGLEPDFDLRSLAEATPRNDDAA
ncbi:MAG TPA: BTAD domain-containing putative transcriptional regulator [Solirubrobacteraceae bacterium]|jgi:DNA-binding SARP family transcriptional activator|nr:BTAD domain-containing putative transcriptional regulator [Solirubrobacteraceae bacterium]